LKDRLRVGLGARDIDDFEDSWFLTVGLTDLPGAIYWLTRWAAASERLSSKSFRLPPLLEKLIKSLRMPGIQRLFYGQNVEVTKSGNFMMPACAVSFAVVPGSAVCTPGIPKTVLTPVASSILQRTSPQLSLRVLLRSWRYIVLKVGRINTLYSLFHKEKKEINDALQPWGIRNPTESRRPFQSNSSHFKKYRVFQQNRSNLTTHFHITGVRWGHFAVNKPTQI
jgi:hypothetical protein